MRVNRKLSHPNGASNPGLPSMYAPLAGSDALGSRNPHHRSAVRVGSRVPDSIQLGKRPLLRATGRGILGGDDHAGTTPRETEPPSLRIKLSHYRDSGDIKGLRAAKQP